MIRTSPPYRSFPTIGRQAFGYFRRQTLVHFVLLGVLVFGLDRLLDESLPDPELIEIGAQRIEQMKARWQVQWRRQPTAVEIERQIQEFVDEEMLYREALAMGLDRDDTIVRRRLVQKFRFLAESRLSPPAPAREQLEAFYQQHAHRYRIPATVSFRQVFFAADRSGEPAQVAARRALVILQEAADDATGVPVPGDPQILGESHTELGMARVEQLFGKTFAAGLMQMQGNGWLGPIDSVYGSHLVRLTDRTAARLPPLAEVRAEVEEDYLRHYRQEAFARYLDELLSRYRVVVHPVDGTGAADAALP